MKRALAAAALVAFFAPQAAVAQQSKLEQAYAKALEQITKGKPDDAVKTMTKAAQEGGAEGQMMLGRLHERLGNLDEAQTAYNAAKAAATGPARADILAALADFTLRKGTAKDALAAANEALAAAPSAKALAAQARALVRNEDGPGALAAADKAVAAGATLPAAHIARGEALIALGRFADAEQALKKAVELDPKSALAYSRLSRAQVSQQGRVTDAVASARKATELDDKFGEGFAILGVALLAENPKNWSDAIAQAQQGAFLDPGNPLVQTAVGKIFEANGQFEQAAGAYRKALQTDAGFAPARLALIQAELNRGNRDAAFAEAKKAAADMPTSPEIQLLIGEMAIRSNDAAGAIPALEKATKGLPGNADGWALLGRAYHFLRRYDEAAEAYKKAVQLSPLNIGYATTLGLVLGQAGELEEGLAVLQKVTSSPGYKDAAGWVNLGWIYRNMNRADESIAAYKKGLELDPKQEQAALGLGWAYQYTKNYDAAIKAYEQAIQIDPKEATPDATIGIAWCYFFKRDMEQARAYADKATAAGRNGALVKENVEKYAKAVASGRAATEAEMEEARKAQQAYEAQTKLLEQANNAVRSRNPASRARACSQLVQAAGAGALNALVSLMQGDPNFDVRIACTNALGSLGPAAKPALPNIDAMIRQDPYDCGVNCTPEQLDAQMKDGDFRRALRDARAKIAR
jgi:tetratricopeptide (TPR) repeat protein